MSFTESQKRAINLLADPEGALHIKEIASAAGVCPSTLYKWRQQPDFQRAVEAKLREVVQDMVSDALAALREKVKEGDLKAIEMIIKASQFLKEDQGAAARSFEELVAERERERGLAEGEPVREKREKPVKRDKNPRAAKRTGKRSSTGGKTEPKG